MSRFIDAAKTVYFRGRKALGKTGVQTKLSADQKREKEIIASLREDGFYVLENYYDRERCDRIRQEMERVLVEFEHRIWRDEVDSDNRAYAAENVSPLVREYFEDPFFARLARGYLGEDQENFFTLANRVMPKPNCKGSGGGWHRDTAQERQFKSILYVVDVDEATGPFEYVPKSHHVSSIVGTILNSGVRFGQYQFKDDEIQRILKECRMSSRKFIGKAGTVVLADTSGMHRGNPPSVGTRFAITNYFFSRDKIAEHRSNNKFTGYFLEPSQRRTGVASAE